MNGPEHYREAERLIQCASRVSELHPELPREAGLEAEGKYLIAAQVHAMLASAAAQVHDQIDPYSGRDLRWETVIVNPRSVAEVLAAAADDLECEGSAAIGHDIHSAIRRASIPHPRVVHEAVNAWVDWLRQNDPVTGDGSWNLRDWAAAEGVTPEHVVNSLREAAATVEGRQ